MASKIRLGPGLEIDGDTIEETFIRASGPGGQNVNKVATAVQLRFDATGAAAIGEGMFRRLKRLAGKRMTEDGILIITADEHRSQVRNRTEALERLTSLLREAAIPPKPRIATKPTKGSKERRRKAKSERSQIKRLRQGKIGQE